VATTEDSGARPEPAEVRVTPRQDGPVVIEGPVLLTRPDGTTEQVDRLFLCRCGRSADKPRCDGSHKRDAFAAPGVPVARKPGRP